MEALESAHKKDLKTERNRKYIEPIQIYDVSKFEFPSHFLVISKDDSGQKQLNLPFLGL